ncbi:MAG: hypothetical protein A2428_17730 [Bdellovibrionales bacterium RIFOXYC1_FULL_54_43]|nr:MAG: hypothetical protein A2428_17730 [Bdellovibrionales bacterium RIFOXYC1_FULL_54_43]
MRFLYIVIRFLPYWAIPLAFTIAEVGVFFRRKQDRMQYFCWVVSAGLVLTVILWIAARGDIHSDAWVRAWTE